MTKPKTITRYATFAVEVTEDWLTDGGDMTVEDGWKVVQQQVRRLVGPIRYAWEDPYSPVVYFQEWEE
jgi:hypothetical protein